MNLKTLFGHLGHGRGRGERGDARHPLFDSRNQYYRYLRLKEKNSLKNPSDLELSKIKVSISFNYFKTTVSVWKLCNDFIFINHSSVIITKNTASEKKQTEYWITSLLPDYSHTGTTEESLGFCLLSGYDPLNKRFSFFKRHCHDS